MDLDAFDFVVSKDGSTLYSSLQKVLNQIPSGNVRPYKIFLKKGRIVFVEFKQPGGKLSPLQIRQIKKLRLQGFTVLVVDSIEEFKHAFL